MKWLLPLNMFSITNYWIFNDKIFNYPNGPFEYLFHNLIGTLLTCIEIWCSKSRETGLWILQTLFGSFHVVYITEKSCHDPIYIQIWSTHEMIYPENNCSLGDKVTITLYLSDEQYDISVPGTAYKLIGRNISAWNLKTVCKQEFRL